MRFPSRLLAANMWFAVMLWAGYLVLVTVITLAVELFGELNQSAWEQATQLPRWYAFFTGVTLVRQFLPLYIAHGQTRREFGAQAAVTVALFAPFLSALITISYLLETALYGLLDRPQVISQAHLFTEPTQVPLVFAEYLLEFLVWIIGGSFIGAGFYRWGAGGLLTIPVGILLAVLAETATGGELRLPLLRVIDLNLSPSAAMTAGVGIGAFVLGLALTWPLIRDVPLRNKA
ncbi:hypothetical protein [Sphaerisporangium sp. TRM90804]|uniref:hypothetical protein n=1 Tax=Sphaerisporangium sp. TRM90804 TaxID=3031113 RepID=UPI002448D2E9|nr:hypothetical protein [Sphaerisporangium sp. TRM90804]MDH2427656.1 hypothetical protein [Sphaerisporangium sp. TRM90804]